MTKPIVWGGVALAITVRFAFAGMGAQERLGRRVEIVTPLTSLMRLAEGQWFKQLGLSPYAGSAYHGSPLLLALLGPLATRGTGGQLATEFHGSFFLFVAADLLGAFFLYKMGKLLESAHRYHMAELQLNLKTSKRAAELNHPKQADGSTSKLSGKSREETGDGKVDLGDLAAVLYLMNPFTVAVCVGGTTSPIENLLVIMALYGALKGNAPLAAFGWALSTHLSMYPAVLLIPISLLMMAGPDRPQWKLFGRSKQRNICNLAPEDGGRGVDGRTTTKIHLQWARYGHFLLFSAVWWLGVILLSGAVLGGHEHLVEMLSE